MNVRQIYAVHPGYSHGHPNSHRSFWKLLLTKRKITLAKNGGSLLCGSFNQAWAHALDLQVTYDDGRRAYEQQVPFLNNPHTSNIDDYQRHWNLGYKDAMDKTHDHKISHFVMLHDDIEPEDSWLETLIEDIVKYDADLMSAVVPIKDGRGLTSTAIDNPKDEFLPERRLTMTEIQGLPDVFTASDCGYPERGLLVNTGCFIARFDRNWRFPPFCFNIADRIRLADSGRFKGHYVAETASEDWQMSRYLHRLGCKVMATKRIKLDHWGEQFFPSSIGPWGDWKWDRAFEKAGRQNGSN
jgi:hypothetical protein